MSLHQTVEFLKKFGIGSAIGIVVVILLVITFNVGKIVQNVLFPPKAQIANHTYGKVPAIIFPDNATAANLTYTLNTLSGGFDDFPDRLNLYKLEKLEPNFLNLENARDKAKKLQFIGDNFAPIPEVPLGDAQYEWEESRGLQRRLVFNIVTFDFSLTSNYLTSLTTLNATGLPDEQGAINVATDMLSSIELMYPDIELSKTKSTEKKVNYTTFPQIYSIRNSELVPATSLSNAQVIRVDLYQKDLTYELNTGLKGENSQLQKKKMTLPILYPHPPYSTMSFWIGMGPSGASVVDAKFTHKAHIEEKNEEPTYSIKTPEEAFEELKNGAGYIAAFQGSPDDTQVLINNVYLAYYLGETEQSYLMPIYVFEGDQGFFGYVSALNNEWVE